MRAVGGEWGRYANRIAGSIGVSVTVALSGCIPSTPRGFDSPDPTSRLVAISEAGESGDASAVPDLIEQLESNDPGARLLAIRSLERITGETLGYHYADPWWSRANAVRRWRVWSVENGAASADPAESDRKN